jgi:hypothetical protein
MARLFISHAWTETLEYERFVCTLDRALDGRWRNLSVPRSKAIDILADEDRRRKDKLPWLQEELWRAEVRLQDPKLPKVFGSRYVFRDGELREVPTVDSVKAEVESLKAQISALKLERRSPQELDQEPDPISSIEDYFRPPDPSKPNKYLSAYVEDHPALSGAIRNRLSESELVLKWSP